jgi:hypothetical protein
MFMKEYKVNAGPLANRMSLAKWLLTLPSFDGSSSRSVPKALDMADHLLGGGELIRHLSEEEKDAAGDICTFEEILWENPYVKYMKEQEEYFTLCKRGAAGDAEAAIAYCKLEVTGIVKHGGMG